MNNIDTSNPRTTQHGKMACAGTGINVVFNIMGILFLTSFLTYLAVHCF